MRSAEVFPVLCFPQNRNKNILFFFQYPQICTFFIWQISPTITLCFITSSECQVVQDQRNGRLWGSDNLIRHICILIICSLRYLSFFNLKSTFYTKLEIYSVFKFQFQKLSFKPSWKLSALVWRSSSVFFLVLHKVKEISLVSLLQIKKKKIIKNKKKVKAMSTVTFQIRKGQAKMYVMVSVSCTSLIPYSTSLLA